MKEQVITKVDIDMVASKLMKENVDDYKSVWIVCETDYIVS